MLQAEMIIMHFGFLATSAALQRVERTRKRKVPANQSLLLQESHRSTELSFLTGRLPES